MCIAGRVLCIEGGVLCHLFATHLAAAQAVVVVAAVREVALALLQQRSHSLLVLEDHVHVAGCMQHTPTCNETSRDFTYIARGSWMTPGQVSSGPA